MIRAIVLLVVGLLAIPASANELFNCGVATDDVFANQQLFQDCPNGVCPPPLRVFEFRVESAEQQVEAQICPDCGKPRVQAQRRVLKRGNRFGVFGLAPRPWFWRLRALFR